MADWRLAPPASPRPWSLTNSLRYELAAQKTQVSALHMGFIDTDLVRTIDAPKISANEVVTRALDALESGLDDVLADERSRLIKQGLTALRPRTCRRRRAS
ncbi:MAG: hypothetical protein ACYDAE_09915 [Steroidobacteraceae bacterium]